MSAPLILLMDAALRAALLGLAVAFLLKLARLRDARAEIMIWTTVLLAALAMPLLRAEVPSWLALPLPHVAFAHSAAAQSLAPEPGHVITLLSRGNGVALVPAGAASLSGVEWLFHHITPLFWSVYALAVAIQLTRLATGLLLTARLYRTATPIAAPWAAGRAIRTSAAISGPMTLGRCILLPADYARWPRNKLLAVLAHEDSHVGRGDFFIQLLANLYRIVFWFSPFAWWLQARLCALAEAASDEAAIRCLDDRTGYAEILVEVSQRAHGLPIQVAMAKGPDIHWRVERILSEGRERHLSVTARRAAVGAILPAALIVAGAHAAVSPAASRLPLHIPAAVHGPIANAPRNSIPAPLPRPANAVAAHRTKITRTAQDDDVTYNPRALLENQTVAIFPAVLFTGNSANR
ncbi:MAG TPA: M56 family metallopeptidase [Rhizomicrobium sp.]|nr:M56 family metallopeptidase [Rhizomicrobium sp.]